MKRLSRSIAVTGAACATLALGACGPGQPEAAQDPQEPQEETTMTEPGASTPVALEAVADLVRRLDVAQAAVDVASVEEVTWRDGSLGCAEPGTMYTQALVDGSRIVLRVEDRTYEYHAGNGRVFWCEKPTQ